MEAIPEAIQKQIDCRLSGFAKASGKSPNLAAAELQTLALQRMGIDLQGNPGMKSVRYSIDRRIVRAFLLRVREDGWKTVGKRRSVLGEVYEEAAGSENRYYLVHQAENLPACVIADPELTSIPEPFDASRYETSTLCSWFLPYWARIQALTLEKDGRQLLLCLPV